MPTCACSPTAASRSCMVYVLSSDVPGYSLKMSALNSSYVFVTSSNAGVVFHSFSVHTALRYRTAAFLRLSSATTLWVARSASRSEKYRSISSGCVSSKLGADRSVHAGKSAKAILGGAGWVAVDPAGGFVVVGVGASSVIWGPEVDRMGACGVVWGRERGGALVGLVGALVAACACCCCCC